MPERNDAMIDSMLVRAAGAIAYPATPALRGRVLAAIAVERAAARQPGAAAIGAVGGPSRRPAFALATIAAAIAVLGATLALALPGSRSAIADFFGIEGSQVERLPTPAPGVTPTPLPTPVDLPDGARPATMAEIEGALGFAAALPEGDAAPVATYIIEYDGIAVAILRYRGFDLWQTKLHGEAFVKGVPQGARVEEFELRPGIAARWISGGEHIVGFLRADGTYIEGSSRSVSRNTLIWATERAFYRVETELSRDEAVRIANSLP